MAGVLNCLAVTAKNIGQDVINGMRGDIGSFTKQYGERILKSNMTKQQIKEVGERGVRQAIKTAAKKDLGEEAFNKILNALNDEFGEATLNNDYEGEGIDTEYTWNADGEEIWAVWGTDMWGTSSGINEIIVSRSIDN